MARRIGIDFGTANTVVAEWDEVREIGKPLDLGSLDLLREGSASQLQRVVPSLIRYRLSGDEVISLFGAQALEEDQLKTGTGLLYRNTKSQITGRAIDVPTQLGSRSILGRDAASEFLATVMRAALLVADDPNVEFVLTAPVESFDRYSEWLVEVADAVGTGRLRITDEATAAAVGYSARMRPGDVFMVVDFGAGTLDVAVVLIQDPDKGPSKGAGSVRTIAKGGIDLGGSHLDMLIAEHFLRGMRLSGLDEESLSRVRGDLLKVAEQTKVQLTNQRVVTAKVENPTTGGYTPLQLDRSDFDDILDAGGVFSRVSQLINKVTDDAAQRGYPQSMFKHVFLVGGTTLVPSISRLIRQRFPGEIVLSDRPLEAVAIGAAAQAGGVELFDHIQHDYAIRHVNSQTGDYEFTTLVEAGTEYPTENPVASFSIQGIRDGQTHMGLAIFEMAHSVYREASSDLEIIFDPTGSARTMAVTAQRKLERSQVWLNEGNPTFLEANPPARAGTVRFRLDFRIDDKKRLTVSAFDAEKRVWVLVEHPVVRLS